MDNKQWTQTEHIQDKVHASALISEETRVCLKLGYIDGETVEQAQVYKYLGVLINDTLTWSDHIDMISKKVSRCRNLLRRLSWFLHCLLLLYAQSYILPLFSYCDVVWYSCTQEESRRLDTLLNLGCKIVLHRCRDSSSTAALRELGINSLLQVDSTQGCFSSGLAYR